MSKFFLDPRDKYFDSVSSISLKSSTQASESRLSQGLFRLHIIMQEKSKKQSFFYSWKNQTQSSLYQLWKEVFHDHSQVQEFDTILKVLNKRKAKVDELWATLKSEECKYNDLVMQNQALEAQITSKQEKILTSSEKSVQVNFLQDSILRKTHDELVTVSLNLQTKENFLANWENMLNSKFDSLIIREKNLHSREICGMTFNQQVDLKRGIRQTREKIFDQPAEQDFWMQVAESVQVDPASVHKLQEFEEELVVKAEEIERIFQALKAEADWLESCKIELIERETALLVKSDQAGVQDSLEESGGFDENDEKKDQGVHLKQLDLISKYENWPIAVPDQDIDCDSIEYLKLVLKEMKEIQKASIKNVDLFEDMISTVIRFTENLIEKEQSFNKVFICKSEYLEQCRNEINQIKALIGFERELKESSQQFEDSHAVRQVTEIEVMSLAQFQASVLEKHSSQIERKILEIEMEEVGIQTALLHSQQVQLDRMSEGLEKKNEEIDARLFEFKSLLQLMNNSTSGNLTILKQEISRILLSHEKNPEVIKNLKLIMSIYLWLSWSHSQASGKDLLRVKLSFYLLRVRVLMLNQGFSIAPVHFSTPADCLWLEIFWLRSRHNYFHDIYANPEITSFTKQWFFKFIIKKLEFAFEVFEKSRNRVLSLSFYTMRNKGIRADKLKTSRLYSKLLNKGEKSCYEIQREMNVQGFGKIQPLLKKFDWVWKIHLKVFVLKWKNFSEKKENEFYRRTVFEIYSAMSELMIKEYRFKEECRISQSVMKGKVAEAGKLLDKILL